MIMTNSSTEISLDQWDLRRQSILLLKAQNQTLEGKGISMFLTDQHTSTAQLFVHRSPDQAQLE